MSENRETQAGGIYHIRVQGELDAKWADWFGGLAMVARGNGETLLTGPVADQAALHGILGKLRDLGLPLLLVRKTACPCRSRGCPRHGRCEACVAHYEARGQVPYCFRAGTRWDKQCAV